MRFALITEGVSEHKIIRHILERYFKESEPFFRPIQPQIDKEKQASEGGWPEVLKYCERTEDLKNIFVDSDYLIIQIDTDQSQITPFDISHNTSGNKAKTVEELYTDVVTKLKSLIHPEVLQEFADKIFFAITIHTIECWFLPLYYTNNDKTKTSGCISKLNIALIKNNIQPLPEDYKNKNSPNSIRTYEAILKNWKKRKDIEEAAQHQTSFKLFVDSLKAIEI